MEIYETTADPRRATQWKRPAIPELYPHLVGEWDVERNSPVTIWQVSGRSGEQRFWLCPDYNHSYSESPGRRADGHGCRGCDGKLAVAGFNDLESQDEVLAGQWDREKNGSLLPSQVTLKHSTAVWWRCELLNHSWPASVRIRRLGHGCRVCAGFEVIAGFNDLESQNPVLAAEWDYDENGDLLPSMVTANSHTIVGWVGSACGHRWPAMVKNRNRNGAGCPVCLGQRVLIGYNDIASQSPKHAAQWDYEKNEDVLPTMRTVSSNKPVWWVCVEKHSWHTPPSARTSGNECLKCSKAHSSRPEAALYRALEPHLTDPVNGGRIPLTWSIKQKSASLDIAGVFGGRQVAIEYDGVYFHKSPARIVTDLAKTRALLDNGWLVIRVRENALPHLPICEPGLLQISHAHRYGRDVVMDVSMAPTAAAILAWLMSEVTAPAACLPGN